MNVGDVYVRPRHGRRYRVVAIGSEPGFGWVQILELWGENPRRQIAIAGLMVPENGWVQEQNTNGDEDAESQSRFTEREG